MKNENVRKSFFSQGSATNIKVVKTETTVAETGVYLQHSSVQIKIICLYLAYCMSAFIILNYWHGLVSDNSRIMCIISHLDGDDTRKLHGFKVIDKLTIKTYECYFLECHH